MASARFETTPPRLRSAALPGLLAALALGGAACDDGADGGARDGGGDTGGGDVGLDGGPDQGGDQGAGETGGGPAGFTVSVALVDTGAVPRPSWQLTPLPGSDSFAIYLDTGGEPRLVASRDGSVAISRLVADGGGWRTSEFLRLGRTAGYDGACQGYGAFTYESIELRVQGEGVVGTARGRVEYLVGDVAFAVPFMGTLSGTADRTPPAARFDNATPHPLDPVIVTFSEALAPGTTVSLLAPGGMRIEMMGDGLSPYQARFHAQGPVDQGTQYTLVVVPSVTDASGNTGDAAALPAITTAAVPLLPEDGFERGSRPLLSGAAEMVNAAAAPIPDDYHALLFRPRVSSLGDRARATARLTVAPGDTVVRAMLRPVVAARQWRQFQTQIVLYAPGAEPTRTMLADAADPLTCPGASPESDCYAAPVELEIPLPRTGIQEVMLDVNRVPWCGLPPPPEPGFLLDLLRVE
jgi:hypothetical protein